MANIPHDQMIFMLTLVATLWQLKITLGLRSDWNIGIIPCG